MIFFFNFFGNCLIFYYCTSCDITVVLIFICLWFYSDALNLVLLTAVVFLMTYQLYICDCVF
jgi:hypothetical protein